MEQPARSTKKTHLPGTPSPGGYHWPPEEGPRSGSSTPGDKTSFTGALLAGESSTPGWPVSIPNPKGLTPLQCLVAGPPAEVGNCQIDAAACPRSGAPRRSAGHVLIGPVCPPRRNAARPAEGTGGTTVATPYAPRCCPNTPRPSILPVPGSAPAARHAARIPGLPGRTGHPPPRPRRRRPNDRAFSGQQRAAAGTCLLQPGLAQLLRANTAIQPVAGR